MHSLYTRFLLCFCELSQSVPYLRYVEIVHILAPSPTIGKHRQILRGNDSNLFCAN